MDITGMVPAVRPRYSYRTFPGVTSSNTSFTRIEPASNTGPSRI